MNSDLELVTVPLLLTFTLRSLDADFLVVLRCLLEISRLDGEVGLKIKIINENEK